MSTNPKSLPENTDQVPEYDLQIVLQDLIDNPRPPPASMFPRLEVHPAVAPAPQPGPNEAFWKALNAMRGERPNLRSDERLGSVIA